MEKEIKISDKDDSRPLCKYGVKCYQKNTEHHKRFKHPPKSDELKATDVSPPAKKLKIDKPPDADVSADREAEERSCEDVDEGDSEDTYGTMLPQSPLDVKENIRQKFLVEMPRDFFDLWEFCKEINEVTPEDALLSDLSLQLVGPYDILNKKLQALKHRRLCNYLCHWRFYYDPPEFQTVIVGKENCFRIGYFRDDPLIDPAFVASMSSVKEGFITPHGDNIFAALSAYVKAQLEKGDPFKKIQLTKYLKKIETYAKEKNYSLESRTERMKMRQKKIVTKSFHGAGITVPLNKETDVGYREIPESNASLKRILKKIVDAPDKQKKTEYFVDLQELITNAQWATDEGDFGMGLELGIDLFIYGGEEFHSSIKHLLTVAYDLLDRKAFATIIQAHLQNRRKGSDMSIL